MTGRVSVDNLVPPQRPTPPRRSGCSFIQNALRSKSIIPHLKSGDTVGIGYPRPIGNVVSIAELRSGLRLDLLHLNLMFARAEISIFHRRISFRPKCVPHVVFGGPSPFKHSMLVRLPRYLGVEDS